ncbi:MAG TPA: hypothetical protein VFG33_05670 [Kribbella sp.]|uniref:hypothetical protein n=1 Tax=Kribbella sp. TaxID=1871183 RepID=UPI002D7A2545|nr:hypothetical protein [Kribbella sp.]HET6292837.1 hypothetical protein [Kribbella sp.]
MSGYATKLSAGVLLALTVTAGPAIAIDMPDPNVPTPTMFEQGPPNYPSYDPEDEAKLFPPVEQRKSGLDSPSVALGALGGIALGGAALGITLTIERRRHLAALRST